MFEGYLCIRRTAVALVRAPRVQSQKRRILISFRLCLIFYKTGIETAELGELSISVAEMGRLPVYCTSVAITLLGLIHLWTVLPKQPKPSRISVSSGTLGNGDALERLHDRLDSFLRKLFRIYLINFSRRWINVTLVRCRVEAVDPRKDGGSGVCLAILVKNLELVGLSVLSGALVMNLRKQTLHKIYEYRVVCMLTEELIVKRACYGAKVRLRTVQN